MTSILEVPVVSSQAMIDQLSSAAAYPHSVIGEVLVHETHISWVFLAGRFAYKVKKPIVTDFLDYGSMVKRHHACCEELRLDSRYAEDLYLEVVPITLEDGHVRMDGDSQPIDFAIRMRRFEDAALLSERIESGTVSTDAIVQLGRTIASFHRQAPRTRSSEDDVVTDIRQQSLANCEYLRMQPELNQDPRIAELSDWTEQRYVELERYFRQRVREGYVRECHGDLHCENIVFWHDRFVPFDGIEFNSALSWIDVLSDTSFLVMDLQRRGHSELSACFLNSYLEQSGDYDAMELLKWYIVYRALVRAKVAWIRSKQTTGISDSYLEHTKVAQDYLEVAYTTTKPTAPSLWITHGVSGSGKTTGSFQFVKSHNAIRLRSDVERKRLFGAPHAVQEVPSYGHGMYSKDASATVYQTLKTETSKILRAGFSVVVDAAFLRLSDRQEFRSLANEEHVAFHIVPFRADTATLRNRITERNRSHLDESDADLAVLERQLSDQEPLTVDELGLCVDELRNE